MPPLDDYVFAPKEIEQGVIQLDRRQRKLNFLAISSTAFFIASALFLFFVQDVVYGFFGLSLSVEQLHLPMSLDAELAHLSSQHDYFFNLIAWFGWLFLKVVLSFIGAFVLVGFLKKFRYFAQRFRSFVLKFVAWLIAFIVIWSGLTAWQYELQQDNKDQTQDLVNYERNIQDSQIAQILAQSSAASPVKSYALAQTALLQAKPDLATAKSYVAQLLQAEKNDAQFEQYGFQAEQIWTMQQQVYGKILSPMAQSVATKAEQAAKLEQIVQWLSILISALFAVLSVIFWALSHFMKNKLTRIAQRLET